MGASLRNHAPRNEKRPINQLLRGNAADAAALPWERNGEHLSESSSDDGARQRRHDQHRHDAEPRPGLLQGRRALEDEARRSYTSAALLRGLEAWRSFRRGATFFRLRWLAPFPHARVMRVDRALAPSVRIGARRRRAFVRAIGLLSALATGSIALVSLAQHGPTSTDGKVRLVWTRGTNTESCATREALMKSVVTRLGYDPFSDEASQLVVGSVTHTRGRYVITLRVDGEQSSPTRQLESSIDDCSAVGEAAALSIALDIEAAHVAASPSVAADAAPAPAHDELDASTESASQTDAAPPSVAPRDAGSLDAAVAAPPSTSRRGASASVGVVGGAGLLPRVAAGIDVSGVVHFGGPLSLSVGMTHFPEVSADDPRFSFGSTLARAGACLDLITAGPNRLGGCAHVVVGSTHLVVEELQPIAPGPRRFAGPSLGLRYARSVGPLVLSAGADALVPIPRYQFDVLGTNRAVFTASSVVGLASVEIGAGF